MNINFYQSASTLLTLATVVFISGILPAHAENTNFTAVDQTNPVTNQLTNDPEQINVNPHNPASTLRIETTQNPSTIESQEVAQTFEPGRATRSGSSYIGVGGNLGITGNTRVGEGSFSVISKVGLTRNLSIRPAALVGDNTVFLVPLTVDFPQENLEITQLSVAPYIGGGVAISTGQDSTVGALITGGVDVPLSQQITATGGVNVSFIDETDVGISLGVGYNF